MRQQIRHLLGGGREDVDRDAGVLVGVGAGEHLGIVGRTGLRDAVLWESVVRLEDERIVVRDGTELV